MMSENWDTIDNLDENSEDNVSERSQSESENRMLKLKKEKTVVKTKFTKLKNKLLKLIEEEIAWPITIDKHRASIRDAIDNLSEAQDKAVDVMVNMLEECTTLYDIEVDKRINLEIEKIESDFAETEEIAQDFLRETRPQPRMFEPKYSEQLSKQFENLNISRIKGNTEENLDDYSEPEIDQEIENFDNPRHFQEYERQIRRDSLRRPRYRDQKVTDKPSNQPSASLGGDMWKQLKRVTIPIFSGDKRQYSNWKAAFKACIDEAPATAEYKFLQLRQYLTGEALAVVENLGHSPASYEAAKDRLDRKYGGTRRQIAVYVEELESHPPIRHGHAEDLEKFADLLDIAVINLRDAGRQQELRDGSLYIKLQKKLTEELLSQYNRWIYENRKIESVETLREFIIQEAEFQTVASETIKGLNVNRNARDRNVARKKTSPSQRSFFVKRQENQPKLKNCIECSGDHGLWACDRFRRKSVADRWDFANGHNLCFRCLGDDHIAKMCLRTRTCGIDGCKRTHNRFLHQDGQATMNSNTSGQNQRKAPVTASAMEGERSHTTSQKNSRYIAMRTVPVILRNGNRQLTINALLDDASTKSYINGDVAAELGLQGEKKKVTVNVLNGRSETFVTSPVRVELQSMDGSLTKKVDVYTADRVTGDLEVVDWNKHAQRWSHIANIKFPKISKRPVVDILIGCDLTELHQSYRDICGTEPGDPIARLTPLGWTCIGKISDSMDNTNFSHKTFVCIERKNKVEEVNTLLKKFWEVEESRTTEENPIINPDDQSALQIAQDSISRTEKGYEIGIPWKKNKPIIPDTYEMALKRLANTEKRLTKDPTTAQAYQTTISTYLDKGYIRKVKTDEIEPKESWYLPHFPVIRMDRATTKTRIVFDASAKSQGISLNCLINQGPKLQRELFDVLLRFRRHNVAIISDEAEMYLRIELKPEDRPFHRFLWRNMEEDRPPDKYEFNRVVFGVNASPFLAQYVTQQHAENNKDQFPKAAETVLKSTYMDDCMDSVSDDETAIELHRQLSELWKSAGMHARKWLSNSLKLLEKVQETDRANEINLVEGQLPSVKTLGVMWSSQEDEFSFKVSVPEEEDWTKRRFLSTVAKLFDPLGFLGPFTIRGKIILQDMWLAGLNWDESLDRNLQDRVKQWLSELRDLTEFRVPRCLVGELGQTPEKTDLHTFVDASESAYGAVTYARTTFADGQVAIRLVAAKTRVAPIDAMSIARLELVGAIIGLRLALSVSRVLEIQKFQLTFWTDSMNVLWWIRGRSRNCKPFVANRISEIQKETEISQWRHVLSPENPADMLSRGMNASNLVKSNSWLEGPTFLKEKEEKWPEKLIPDKVENAMTETKRQFKTLFVTEPVDIDRQTWKLQPNRFSTWKKLIRISAWAHRFIRNCQSPKSERKYGELSIDEIEDAEINQIVDTQKECFSEEYTVLRKGRQLPYSSKLLSLRPVIDEDGLMRMNGRLKFAEFIAPDAQSPIILPRRSWITKLIVRDHHEKCHHAGTNQTLASLSTRFWIVSAREAIREWENECTECKRQKTKPAKQVMAPLPKCRYSSSLRAFSKCAVDYAGPFITVQGRGKRRAKRYLCLFTCLSSRAVHLELAYKLDTDSFLNALYRMTSRRGVPDEMISDNGTNFVGAVKELRQLIGEFDTEKLLKSGNQQGMKWKFNPPSAPHFGGVFESMIKSAKRAIYAILNNADVSDEELMTAFAGAEALINSRPLTYQTSDPRDEIPLTPNHFLHGQAGGQFAPAVDTEENEHFHPRKRWRHVQQLMKHVWRRWLREWLPQLNSTKRWYRVQKDFREGDVVLVVNPDTPRGELPLGRVTKTFPGADGHVRVVEILMGGRRFVRPVTRLCPLECGQND